VVESLITPEEKAHSIVGGKNRHALISETKSTAIVMPFNANTSKN
jgi:hypothetical protein